MWGHFQSQLPTTKANLSISDPHFGSLLLTDDVGTFLAQAAANCMPSHLQAAYIAPLTGSLVSIAAGLANLSHKPAQFGPAMLAFGITASLCDIAINIQIVSYGAATGRADAPFFHGLFSMGQLLGSGIGSLMTQASFPFVYQVGGTAVALAAAFLLHLLFRSNNDGSDDDHHPAQNPLIPISTEASEYGESQRQKTIILLAFVGLFSSIGEGALSEWAGIYLHQNLGTTFATANRAAFAYASGMTIARLAGMHATKVVGIKNMLIGGSLLAALAMGAGLMYNQPASFLIAVAVTAAGLANITPLSMTVLSKFSSEHQAKAVSRITLAQQIGFFTGPVLIGTASGIIGLRWAIGIISFSSLAITLLSIPLSLAWHQFETM